LVTLVTRYLQRRYILDWGKLGASFYKIVFCYFLEEAMASSPVAKRFIYGPEDMEQFRNSQTRKELLDFASSMGRSCINFDYNPQDPLVGLSPAMASLHGSLSAMQQWTSEILPHDARTARFGNPAFREWHARLVKRSQAVITSMLQSMANINHPSPESLQNAWQNGHDAASHDPQEHEHEALLGEDLSHHTDKKLKLFDELQIHNDEHNQLNPAIVEELQCYLRDAFGHAVRLDYGTGHESSFLVLLYATTKLLLQGQPPKYSLGPVALSVFAQYLKVTRSVQLVYILEPAGSHGVWGLDDYYCLAFYFGACQLINNPEGIEPSSIHDTAIMSDANLVEKYMYLSCIDYIRRIKTGVPFFESSPMLNDISQLPSWQKVSQGLLRLYEGEVLDKRPVVQHFVFGALFKATWTPSHAAPTAPQTTFATPRNAPPGVRPMPDVGGDFVPTRAPWAK